LYQQKETGAEKDERKRKPLTTAVTTLFHTSVMKKEGHDIWYPTEAVLIGGENPGWIFTIHIKI